MSAPRHPEIRQDIPLPNTPEGELFIYTPEETAQWTPLSARTLRDKATAGDIPRASGKNQPIRFNGQNIRDINRICAEAIAA